MSEESPNSVEPVDESKNEEPPSSGVLAPVGATGYLLRRVPSDAAKFTFPHGPTNLQAYIPSDEDVHGLYVSIEGSAGGELETATTLLVKSSNDRIQKYGGVVAVQTTLVLGLGLSVDRDDEGSIGHCLIPGMSRPIYERDKKPIKALADKLARLSQIRIAPKPISKSAASS